MISLKEVSKNFSNWEKILLSIGTIGYAAIIYKYRIQMGDFGDFTKAGKLIWENVDPYSRLMYVNSPVSAVIVFGLNKAFPFIFVPVFWQLVNLLGLAFFIRTIVSRDYHRVLPAVFSIFAFLNVTRALFANVQVTGMVLGLIAIGITLFRNGKSTFISILPIWFALELKPQLAIGFIAIFLFQGKIQKLRILVLGIYVVMSHSIVELKFAGDINVLWIEKLLKYSSGSLKEGYEISFWKVIATHINHVPIVRLGSLFAIIIILISIVIMALKGKIQWAIFLAMISPILNTYLHLYDLALVCLCFLMGMLIHGEPKFLIATIAFLTIFPLTLTGQLLSFCILSTFIFLSVQLKNIRQKYIKLTLLVFPFSVLATQLLKNESQELQMGEVLVLPVMLILALTRKQIVGMFNTI